MDDILLASLVASSKEPGAYAISSDAFSQPEPYAIMLRRDDPAFKKVVDTAVANFFKSPEGVKTYEKWFQRPIPPKGPEPQRPDVVAGLAKAYQKPDRLARPGHVLSQTEPLPSCAERTKSLGGGVRTTTMELGGSSGSRRPEGVGTYLDMLLSGLRWTLATALFAWLRGRVQPTGVGVLRTLPASRPGVRQRLWEFFRNIPLLVQLFLWFFVLPELGAAQLGLG